MLHQAPNENYPLSKRNQLDINGQFSIGFLVAYRENFGWTRWTCLWISLSYLTRYINKVYEQLPGFLYSCYVVTDMQNSSSILLLNYHLRSFHCSTGITLLFKAQNLTLLTWTKDRDIIYCVSFLREVPICLLNKITWW